MSQFQRWAQKEHSTRAQILALVPAGIILLLLLPYWLLVICPSLDRMLGLAPPSPAPVTIIAAITSSRRRLPEGSLPWLPMVSLPVVRCQASVAADDTRRRAPS